MSNNINNKRIAKNTIFLFIRMLIVMCVGLYTSRIVLSTLGVEDFGTYNVVGSMIVLFSFLQTALTNATYRFFTYELGIKNFEKLNKIFSSSLNAHYLLVLIILFLSETVGLWFLNYKLHFPDGRLIAANWAYQLSILSFCVNIIRTPYNSAIIAHEKMSFFAITSILEAVLKLLIVYLLVVWSIDKLILYSLLIFGVSIILYLIYWLYCRKMFIECTYKWIWDKLLLKKMMTYSAWSILVNAADVGVTQSIVFFFNVFFGVVANAALGIANQVNNNLVQFLQSFAQSFNPQIIKSYASGDRDYFLNLIFSTSKLSYFMLYIVSLPILLNISFILKIWLGTVPDMTSTFIVLIIAYSLIDAYSAPLWTAVHATGNLKTHQLIISSIKILNIPLAYIFLKMGLAAYIALLIKVLLNFICSIIRPIYMKSLIQLPLKKYLYQVFLKVYLITVLSLPIPLWLYFKLHDGWTKLLTTSVCSVFVTVVLIYFIGLTVSEKELIFSFIKRRKK